VTTNSKVSYFTWRRRRRRRREGGMTSIILMGWRSVDRERAI
jgi:hypothetical protein